MIIYVPLLPIPHLNMVPFPGCPKERRALAFFAAQTAKCFQTEFSSQYLLRAANEEPALRHAIIALSGMHEYIALEQQGERPMDQFSDRQYSKALALLSDPGQMSSGHAAEVLLLSCILFACFESLRGHIKSAITHVRFGMKLLDQTTASSGFANFAYVPKSIVRSLFTRLDNQIMELESSTDRKSLTQNETFSPTLLAFSETGIFHNLEQAYEKFDVLLNRVLHMDRSLEIILVNPGVNAGLDTILDIDIEIQRKKCLQYLDNWSQSFDRYLAATKRTEDELSDYNTSVLHIWRITAHIFLAVRHIHTEQTWDRFQEDFDTIVTLAEDLVRSSHDVKTDHPGFSFSFHLGIISPLYFTTVRCREPGIRRRALDVLSTVKRCEGIWNSQLTATVARHAIDAEEEVVVFNCIPEDKTSDIYGIPVVDLVHRRIREILVAFEDAEPPKVELHWDAPH